jgi:hypothetical protein
MNTNVYTDFDGDCIARWSETTVCGFTAPQTAFTIADGIDCRRGRHQR